jgi:hypothetical protein
MIVCVVQPPLLVEAVAGWLLARSEGTDGNEPLPTAELAADAGAQSAHMAAVDVERTLRHGVAVAGTVISAPGACGCGKGWA